MILTPGQNHIHSNVINDILDRRPLVTYNGPAGSGKTTLSSFIIGELMEKRKTVAVATITGRASKVIGSKLKDIGITPTYCGTIHGLMYKPRVDKDGNVKGWSRRAKRDMTFDIIFIDESSMVPKMIMEDLMKYHVPIIACGDQFQLPPISRDNVNYAEDADYSLTEIIRQSLDSGIIRASIDIRNTYQLSFMDDYNGDVIMHDKHGHYGVTNFIDDYSEDSMILCSYNNTRNRVNGFVRNHIGFDSLTPERGELVMNLMNDRTAGVMNGDIGTVVDIGSPDIYDDGEVSEVYVDFGAGPYKYQQFTKGYVDVNQKKYTDNIFRRRYDLGTEHPSQRHPLFMNFAYCATVHKAQGSEWQNVMVFDEPFNSMSNRDNMRLKYTAITRAKDKVLWMM